MIVLLLALAACSDSSIPPQSRRAEGLELAIADSVRVAWEQHGLPWLEPECERYWSRMRVVDADRGTLLELCWRDEPGQCAQDASQSRYGCAAGCAIVRSVCDGIPWPWPECEHSPIAIVSDALGPDERTTTLRHEMTHLLGLGACVPVPGNLEHTNPRLWAAAGVTPL